MYKIIINIKTLSFSKNIYIYEDTIVGDLLVLNVAYITT